MQCFDPDQRQVPMGFGRPKMFRPLEERGDFGLLLRNDAFCDDRLKRPIFAVNTRRQPKRDPEAIAEAIRRSCFK